MIRLVGSDPAGNKFRKGPRASFACLNGGDPVGQFLDRLFVLLGNLSDLLLVALNGGVDQVLLVSDILEALVGVILELIEVKVELLELSFKLPADLAN